MAVAKVSIRGSRDKLNTDVSLSRVDDGGGGGGGFKSRSNSIRSNSSRMPVCKAEAHRALELLEDYYARLDENEEKELKVAIERVIKIFKSRLFQALLDIQEFYELTLMDDCKTSEIKTNEALEMASRWEMSQRPFAKAAPSTSTTPAPPPVGREPNSNLLPGKMKEELLGKLPELKAAAEGHPLPTAPKPAPSAMPLFDYDEIILERGSYGLGFSIAGGIDNPHIGNDTSIYITKLIPGGAAAMDKRLRVNDIILKVNDVNVVNVSHSVAVEALKKAGNRVVLAVKRKVASANKENEELMEVELAKGSKGLGFTIAGGIGNQHIPGDNGIYVTKIMEGGAAAADRRIDVGDRLVSVKNYPGGEFVLDNCTHEEAVNALKKCKDKVILVIAKAETHYPSSPTIAQMQSMGMMVAGSNNFSLPHRSVSDEDLRAPRDVVLHKSAAGLGFNIVGGEDGEGIFISFILGGGPADTSGQVRRGDKIVSVNGIDLSRATHEDAAVALKNAGNVVNLRLFYSPEEYEKFEAKIHSIKNQVRLHSPQSHLSFKLPLLNPRSCRAACSRCPRRRASTSAPSSTTTLPGTTGSRPGDSRSPSGTSSTWSTPRTRTGGRPGG